jgi:hypothetical protein
MFCSVLILKKVVKSIEARYRFSGFESSLMESCSISWDLAATGGSPEVFYPSEELLI